MKQSKKYNCRVIQEDDSWTAEVTRRVTSRVIVVSKGKGGFATEAEAQAWGQAEVEALLKKTNLAEMEKRREKQKAAEILIAKKVASIEKIATAEEGVVYAEVGSQEEE